MIEIVAFWLGAEVALIGVIALFWWINVGSARRDWRKAHELTVRDFGGRRPPHYGTAWPPSEPPPPHHTTGRVPRQR